MVGDGLEIELHETTAVGRATEEVAANLPGANVRLSPDSFGLLAAPVTGMFNGAVGGYDEWVVRTRAELMAFADHVHWAVATIRELDHDSAEGYAVYDA